jgi:hypothetical protein
MLPRRLDKLVPSELTRLNEDIQFWASGEVTPELEAIIFADVDLEDVVIEHGIGGEDFEEFPPMPDDIIENEAERVMYQHALREAPLYKEKESRYDPFNKELLYDWIANEMYSVFLDHTIITFHDALQHAKSICRMWHAEDDAEGIRNNRSDSAVRKAREREKARLEWKDAILMRKNAIEAWDKFVAYKKELYRKAKGL